MGRYWLPLSGPSMPPGNGPCFVAQRDRLLQMPPCSPPPAPFGVPSLKVAMVVQPAWAMYCRVPRAVPEYVLWNSWFLHSLLVELAHPLSFVPAEALSQRVR